MSSSLIFLLLGTEGSVYKCFLIIFYFGAVWSRTGIGQRGLAHRCAAWGGIRGAGARIRQGLLFRETSNWILQTSNSVVPALHLGSRSPSTA